MPLTEHQKKLRRENYARNKERILEYNKKYKATPEQHLKATQKYRQTEKGQKSVFKTKWKKRGVDMNDFEDFWTQYWNATKCERCDISFNKAVWKEKKCLDHCHETGKFRAVVCWNCNVNVIR